MNLVRHSIPFLMLPSLILSSCGEDPLLVEKREKQKAEITRLKGELSLIEEKLKNVPPDVSAELAAAKQLHEKQSAEVENLDKEIASLETRKRTLQAEYDAYRIKYQVK